jgi:glycosyltransferase involved in cell wall biosynthesis
MVPFATSASLIGEVLRLQENQHHAWGVKELLASGVEVSVLTRFGRGIERFGHDWLAPDTGGYDLVYSNHNRLVRTPLASLLKRKPTPFVSLVYAGEGLVLPSRHFGLLCMTPVALSRFEQLGNVRVRYAPWGIDPESRLHQRVGTDGEHYLSTGVTGRDFSTLVEAARLTGEKLVVAARGTSLGAMPANVRVIDEFVGPWAIRELYEGAFAGLVILARDDQKRSSMGWTNVLELMAVGLPIIKTRTGALDDIVNLEEIGAGILVEPERPDQIAAAVRRLRDSDGLRAQMGAAGAEYVRKNLTMEQFAEPLIELVFAAANAR